MLSIDLGESVTINSIFPRTSFDGTGRHVPQKMCVEVATESKDGLKDGNWELVGQCDSPTLGAYLPFFFEPRPVRYVRIVVNGCNAEQPWINAFELYKPFYDAKDRAEGRVSWFVPGRTSGERQFFIYFNKITPGSEANPQQQQPEKVAIIREAEDTVNTYNCSGVGFGKAFDKTASGPSNPNILSYFFNGDQFVVPAGFAVTIPRSGTYTIILRVRGNSCDHFFRVLSDNRELFKGAFGIEGDDWNMVSLPPMELAGGIHYLELQMKLGPGNRPLDLDMVVITDAKNYQARQCLQAFPGSLEVRP